MFTKGEEEKYALILAKITWEAIPKSVVDFGIAVVGFIL